MDGLGSSDSSLMQHIVSGHGSRISSLTELENLEVVTADDGGGGDGNTVTVHGDKAPVDGKGEAATPAKRADVSGGQECGVVRVEDVQRVETPAAEITNAMKDTEIVKNKDQERGGSEREEEETSMSLF
uniref:Uncharacterized protein n=1 Tax=Oryza glumipatula TaxID=40148 RepID=A0A0D9YH21_9ORYZ